MVDAVNIVDRLEDEKPEGVENEAVEQLAFADKVLLNKVDLVQEGDKVLERIEARIRSINAACSISRVQLGGLDTDKNFSDIKYTFNCSELLHIGGFNLARVLEFEPEFLNLDDEQEHLHDERVSSVSVKFAGELNVAMLEDWV